MVQRISVRTLVDDGSLVSHLLTDVGNSLCSLRDCRQRSSGSHHVQLSPPDEGRIEEPVRRVPRCKLRFLFLSHLWIFISTLHPPSRRDVHITIVVRNTCRTIRDARFQRWTWRKSRLGWLRGDLAEKCFDRNCRELVWSAETIPSFGKCLISRHLNHTCVPAVPFDVVEPRCATRVSALSLESAWRWRPCGVVQGGGCRGEMIVHPSRPCSPFLSRPSTPPPWRTPHSTPTVPPHPTALASVHPSTPRPPTSRRGESGIKCRPKGW